MIGTILPHVGPYGIFGVQLHDHPSHTEDQTDGPVSNAIFPLSPPSWTSFGMKSPFNLSLAHNAGCLNSLKSTNALSPSTISGRHLGSPSATEDLANEIRQSSSDNARTARSQTPRSASNSPNNRFLNVLMAWFRLSVASFRLRIIGAKELTFHLAVA